MLLNSYGGLFDKNCWCIGGIPGPLTVEFVKV